MQRSVLSFKIIIRLVAAIFLISVVFSSFPANVFAAAGINRQINFQGKLVDGSGLTVADSTYTITFSFYNGTSGGNPLWIETDNVTTVAGIFRVSLGVLTPIPASFNFNWDGLYLGLKISTESQEMVPRIAMTAVPMAFNAQQVAGLTVQDENSNASTSGTLKIPNAKTVSFAGATSFGAGTTGLVTLGSNSNTLALTTSGNTSVALPGGGTLLTDTTTTNQTVTSTQSTGTVLGITDSTALSGSIKGLVITLSGANGQDQTGLEFNLSNANGTNLYDIMGTGGNWKVSKNGALTVTSCVGCGGGSNWSLNATNGTLNPNNNTLDFLIGGIATTSAKFAILNVATVNPIASIAGTFSLGSSAGTTRTIGATAMNPLQLGNASTGDLIFAPNNATAMTIKNGGYVGIGTTNPLEVLSITGNASLSGTLAVNTVKPLTGALNLQYKSGGNAWSNGLTILDNTGLVGIGTTNPTQALEVNGTVKATAFSGPLTGNVTGNVSGTAGSLAAQYIDWNSSSGGNSIANKPTLGTISSQAASNVTITGGTLAGLTGLAIRDTSAAYDVTLAAVSFPALDAGKTLTLNMGNASNSLIFSAASSITFPSGTKTLLANSDSFILGSTTIALNRLSGAMGLASITSLTPGADFTLVNNGVNALTSVDSGAVTNTLYLKAGNVGIGTTAPLATLDVSGSASISANISMDGAYLAAHTFNILNNGTLNFQRSPSGDAGLATNSVLYLGNNGNVGIGTTNPTALFSVGSSSLFRADGNGNIWVANCTGCTGSNYWAITNNSLSPGSATVNPTFALNLGSSATSSALFHVSGISGDDAWFKLGTGSLGIGTTSPLATIDIRGNSGTEPIASISGNTAMAGLVVDQSGTGDIFTASVAGATKFVLGNSGNVTIGGNRNNPGYKLDVIGSARIGNNSATDDIVKQTTADFTVTSPTSYSVTTFDGVNNVSTANNQMALVTDITSQAGYSLAAPAAGPTLPNTLTTASLTFQLPSRRFALLSGNGLKIYDPAVANSNFGGGPTFTAGTIGAGVQAFQRADGAFVIILGGGTTATQLYTPGSTPSTEQGTFAAGPITSAAVGAGSLVIKRSDGKFIIIHGGGAGTTSIYDPTVVPAAGVALIAGPAIAAGGVVNTGSFAFQRPDGKWIVGLGGATGTTTNIYDPSTSAGGVGGGGSFVAGPSLGVTASGAGAHAIQLPDGRMMVILGGGSGATAIYDPVTGAFSAGNSLASSQTVGAGGHSFQRSDGKWVVVLGATGTGLLLQLYDPVGGVNNNGTFTTTTGLTGAGAGTGAHTFQRPDGMYVIVHGNSQSTSTLYDAGWNTSGTWISEDLTSTKISTYSALFWSANPQSANNTSRLDAETISFFVKTGENSTALSNNPWVGIQDSGDLIKTIGLSTLAKIKVVLVTPVRSYPQGATDYINQTNIWNGEGGTFYRRTFIQPTVFSMKIKNPMVAYGDLTGTGDPSFGRNFATDSATLEGVVTDNSNFLKLQTIRNLPVASTSAGFIIASASANLGATAAAGTHTIERATGQFLTLIGGAQVTRIYDPDSNTFSAGPALALAIGAGAHSFLLPDGRFFTVCGGGTNNTMIFDPQVNLFTAGPKLYGNVGLGASSFERSDGFFVIVDGGASQVTNILDPYAMAITQGPFTLGAITNGSFNIRYQDGRVLVMQGGSTASYIYDPQANAFKVGPILTASTTGAGTTVGQLPSGRFWIKTALLTSQIFDPYLDSFALGPAANATINAGAIMIPTPDGRLLYGAGAGVSSIVDPAALNTAVAGPTLPCTLAAGSNVFQRPTGEYVVLCGNGANTFIIDAGWNLGGTYTSEQIFEPNLSSTTGMYWKNIGQGDIMVKYRTSSTKVGLGLAQWKQLPDSGSLLSYTPGDVWFQTRIDLQGILQDLPGAKTRVWLSENNGGAVAYYRAVQAPILQYWELMSAQDPTLLDIASGNQDIFRFTADGQAYTSDGGAWNSGGADLAERYTSTQDLQAGEVVIGDRLNSQNVIRSTSPYQTNIMGVVSTQPGFVAGNYTPDSYPIALVGRVPVKISTENGAIHSGDYLTSSSIPGYAMKATMAGRVIGTALEDFDPATAIDCPKYGAGSLPATQCGTITVFVNLTSYNGENVESLMADTGFTGGLAENGGLSTGGYASAMTDQQQQTLAFLKSIKDRGQANGSEVFADKVNAATQVISPTIITDLLIAKTIKADQIEGLQILTNRISALEDKTPQSTASAIENLSREVLAESTPSANLNSGMLNIADINVDGIATVSGNLRVKNNALVEGVLNVVDTVMSQNLIVNQLATFLGDAVFKGNVSIEGRPTFNRDVAGLAVIDKGNDFVEVKFNNEYESVPIVTATISLNRNTDDETQKNLEEDILNGNFNYVITRKTTKGFIIRLNKKATSGITFSWVAISVKDPVTTEGKTTFQDYLNSLNNTATPSATSTSDQ